MSKHVWTVAGAWLVTGQRSHWRLRDSRTRNLGVAVVTSADLEIPEIPWLDSLKGNVLQVQPQPYPTSATSLSFRPNSASAKLSHWASPSTALVIFSKTLVQCDRFVLWLSQHQKLGVTLHLGWHDHLGPGRWEMWCSIGTKASQRTNILISPTNGLCPCSIAKNLSKYACTLSPKLFNAVHAFSLEPICLADGFWKRLLKSNFTRSQIQSPSSPGICEALVTSSGPEL